MKYTFAGVLLLISSIAFADGIRFDPISKRVIVTEDAVGVTVNDVIVDLNLAEFVAEYTMELEAAEAVNIRPELMGFGVNFKPVFEVNEGWQLDFDELIGEDKALLVKAGGFNTNFFSDKIVGHKYIIYGELVE